MVNKLSAFAQSHWYWLAVFVVGLLIEVFALYYQYVLDEPPCVLCIQARVWVLAGMLIALIALATRKWFVVQGVLHLGLVASLALLLERSWTVVLIERGLYEGQCGMDPGFPAWLALDEWLPAMFEVWVMCGYTPILALGISMGEALVASSILLMGIAIIAFVLTVRAKLKTA